MIDRRAFLGAFAWFTLGAPSVVIAQGRSGTPFRVGCLYVAGAPAVQRFQDAFVAELRDLGHVEGRNLIVDFRVADGDVSRLPGLVNEMLDLKPDVLVGIEAVAVVMKAKTDRIPIVLTSSNDPVRAGLAYSLARPGANVTGLTSLGDELIAKHIDLLREIKPGLSRVGLLNDLASPATQRFEQVARESARATNLSLSVAGIKDGGDLARAFALLQKARVEALVVVTTGYFHQMRKEILNLVGQLRIPAASGLPVEGWGELGGLLTYGFNFIQGHRRAAHFVDRILKGARPGDLPVEQISQFDFSVNLRTARAIGIGIPQATLLRANRVIE